MSNIASLATVAALIGEPARTAMLITLMDGRALTAGELGNAAGIAPSTASGHLGQLLDAGLVALERQGRHRYYRLASPAVAALLEELMSLAGELGAAATRPKPVITGPRDRALRRARLCYDHLAGEIAVAIADSMAARGQLDFTQDGGALTDAGATLLVSIGVDLAPVARGRRGPFCRPCLDWSERKPHIAGLVGRKLYATMMHQGWMRQLGSGRAISVTPLGLAKLQQHFGLVMA